MRLNHIFSVLFATLVPSVLISFGLNAAILIILTLIALYRVKLSEFKPYLKNYLLFNAFSFTILLGIFLDLIFQNPIESNQLLKRLSFVVLPIIVLASTRRIQELALYFYVYFLSALSLILLSLGLYRGLMNKGEIIYGNWNSELTESFYDQDMLLNWGELSYKRFFLNIDMHPSYYALASIFAVMILLFYSNFRIKSGLKYGLSFLHVLIVVLLSSKAGLLSVIVISIVFIFTIRSKKSRIILLLCYLTLSLGFFSIPSTQLRIKNSLDSVLSSKSDTELDSTTERIVLWSSLKDYDLKELFFGLGNEGAKIAIVEKSSIEKNMHNQFFQALLSSGLVGFLLLLCFVFTPFNKGYKPLSLAMILVVVINLFFENMLDRIWGITIISFFYALIVFGNLVFKKDDRPKRSNFNTFNQS